MQTRSQTFGNSTAEAATSSRRIKPCSWCHVNNTYTK